jgi:hypothetical protein
MLIKIKYMVLASACIMMLLKPMDTDARFVRRSRVNNMSIDKKNLRELVVRPTLEEMNNWILRAWSESAEELIMLTFAQETKLGTYLKQGWKKINDGRGVGRGIGSMEVLTFNWLKQVYPDILGGRNANELVWDLKLAVKATRLKYLTVTEALPEAGDIKGLAKYWDKYYNGNPEVGTWEEAVENYNLLVK